MSEEDTNLADQLLLQAGQISIEMENEGVSGTTEGDTENNIHQEKKLKVEDDPSQRVFSPSSVAPVPAVTVGAELSRPSSVASPRKPKKVGGFLADDSDEEDQASTPTSLPVPPTNRTVSPSPLQNSVTQAEMGASVEPTGVVIAPPVTPTGASPFVKAPSTAFTAAVAPKVRLQNDKVGILEDRIAEDPRGDMEAWLGLISEYRGRNKLDEARAVYKRFFVLFPQAAEIWVQWVNMELDNDNFAGAEAIFGDALLVVPSVPLWTTYLTYIRRMNVLTDDATGNKRTTVQQCYEFVLNNIGVDRDSGQIWQEYIQFLHQTPGQIGGTTWQDGQKLDHLRKAYHRATCVPMFTVTQLWKEYDQFELGVNKMTARKHIQERSPSYMTARSANTALENITRGLLRTTLPKLPPAPGFDGSMEYSQQLSMWKRWIAWEQEDPLVLKSDELDAYKKRVLYVYKQAGMALRFWPEIWVDAAEWCYTNGLEKDGDEFIASGIDANPESCLTAFKHADRVEFNVSTDVSKGAAEQGVAVRAPYNKLLDALYSLINSLKAREAKDLQRVDESAAIDATISAITGVASDQDEESEADKQQREADKVRVREKYKLEALEIQRTISAAWIALMRAMRRVQGKGAVKSDIGGSRQIFADARQKGKILSDVYVASALLEQHVYKDPAATKIFLVGAKLFPEDAPFTLEYLKHLLSINDLTNARVAFEKTVSRLTAKPELVHKSKILYSFFHKYESQYGELSQIRKLETRMAELFPDDPKLHQFAARYSSEAFDPCSFQPIISPATQLRKGGPPAVIQSIETVQDGPQYMQQSPNQAPQYMLPTINSPKRPLPIDDIVQNEGPARKMLRGQSPLKGAAGRRLEQQRMHHQPQSQWAPAAPPFVIPRDITFLMSIMPRAETYNYQRFNPDAMVRLLSNTYLPDYATWKAGQHPSVHIRERY